MKLFSTSKGLEQKFQDQPPHFLVVLLFKRMSQPSIHDQLNGKLTYFSLPPTQPANIGPKDVLRMSPSNVSRTSPKDPI